MNSLTDFQEPVPPKSHKAIFILTGKKNMAHEHFFPTALALVQLWKVPQRWWLLSWKLFRMTVDGTGSATHQFQERTSLQRKVRRLAVCNTHTSTSSPWRRARDSGGRQPDGTVNGVQTHPMLESWGRWRGHTCHHCPAMFPKQRAVLQQVWCSEMPPALQPAHPNPPCGWTWF